MPGDIHPSRSVPTAADLSDGANATPRGHGWWRFITHEPFFQFIVLGFLIWGGAAYFQAHSSRYTIVITPADRQRMAEVYFQQFREAPSAEQLKALMDRHIRDEIYVREAMALNLDQDDEIIRRRLAQKYEFLQIDLAVPDTPKPEILARWFEANKDRYVAPELVSFTHIYFSTDKLGDEAARLKALKVRETLERSKRDRQPDLGDPFPGPADVAAMSPKDAARLFGESEIVKTLFQSPLNQWVGPVKSAFGWHLIYVTEHLPAKHPALDEVRDWVRSDWVEDQRRRLQEHAFEKLRAKYTVRDEGAGR